MTPTISAISKDKWLIRVERTLDGESASGQVVVLQQSPPEPEASPHLSFAGARAWLGLAQARRAAKDLDAAIASAQAGIEELGQQYYSVGSGLKDDTSQHIDLAEELVEQGDLNEAARRLIGVLETRVQLYAEAHSDTIGE